MKFIFILLNFFYVTSIFASPYDLELTSINGNKLKLSEFKNKVLVVVNIASQCGFTSQLKDLEALYQRYKAKGLVVVGVPSNEFGGQTPQDNQGMANFCEVNYGVTFPLLEKSYVKKEAGEKRVSLYTWLTSTPDYQQEIGWNFIKFLVNREGKVIGRYSSMTKPLGDDLEKDIQKNL